jgi:hypothetical protein
MANGASAPSEATQLSLGGITLVMLVYFFDPCICFRFDSVGLIGAIPAALFAWMGLIKNRSLRFPARCGFGLVAIVATFLLLKVTVDVLWTGHEPLFAQPQWVEHWIYRMEYRGV